MAISRMHPCANWLRLPAHETRRALNKVLDFRDKSADPTVSGMPPAAVEWFYSEELPRLCTRPDVKIQVEQQITELLHQAATIESEFSPQQLTLQRRLDELTLQVDILTEALG